MSGPVDCKMLSATDCDLIVDAALQIIDSSVDPEGLFNEACSLSKKLKLQNGKSKSTYLETPMESFLSVTCQDHQRRFRNGTRNIHPIPTLAQQIIDLWAGCCQTGEPLLSREALKKFENILMHLQEMTASFWYDGSLFESLVTKHNLSLEIIWDLQRIGAMSLDMYMSNKLNEEPFFIEKFSHEFVSLCQGSSSSYISRQRIISGLTEYLIKKGFGEGKSTLKRSAVLIVDSVLKGILDLQVTADEVKFLASPADFLSYSEIIPKQILKRFSTYALFCMLSFKAASTVSETLRLNADWRSLQSFETAREVFKQLFLPLSCEDVAQILLQSLDQLQISGDLTFILLTTMHRSYQKAAKVINAQIKTQLTEGLDNSNTVKISAAFLLARQSSVIGCDGFVSYAEWFESTFGDSSHSLAATKPTFTCLIKFLSHLVPFESAEYLKTHIMKRPAIPSKCRHLYDDYIALAKTRLEDLKVPLHDLWKGIYEKSGSSKSGCSRKVGSQAEEDVERAVEAFAESGKIPTLLIEASIFRKPYFVGKFLPALLRPRHLPDEPDMKMKLITEVYNSGKMPASLYNKYLEGCEKEKQALLEGIFDVDEDELEEMALPSLHQLSLRLNKYIEAVSSRNHDKVSECLSLIFERVNLLMGNSSPLATPEKVSHDDIIVVDLAQPSRVDCSMQVISELICAIHILINKWNKHEEMEEQRLGYLKGMDRLISSLIKDIPDMKSTLYLYILTHLTSQEKVGHTLDMFAVAAVCVSLMNFAGAVDVKVKKPNSLIIQSSYRDIVHAVGEHLDLYGENLDFVLRFWLCYVDIAMFILDAEEKQVHDIDVMELGGPSGTESQLLPSHVVKRVILLCRRQIFDEGRQENIRAEDLQPLFAVASSVLSNPRWKFLSQQHQPTIGDWVDLEQSVLSQMDTLLSHQRADYMWGMSLSLLKNTSNPTNPLGFCSEVLQILSHNLAETSRNLCCGLDEIPVSVEDFLQVLTRHLTSFPNSDMINTSWLASVLESAEAHPYKDTMLRLAIELPPHLLFCCSQAERISRIHIDSSLTVLSHFCNSSQNRGGFLSQKATIFFIQAIVWAQDNTADVCELKRVMKHPLLTVSVLEHRKVLDDQGLIKQLDAEWTSELFKSLEWAQRLVDKDNGCANDKGSGCTVEGTRDVWHQGLALFIVLLHKQHCEVILEGSVIRSQSDVFVCLLELVVAHLAVNPDLLNGVGSSCKGNVFVSVATKILRKTPEVLVRLLDRSDTSVCELRNNLGQGHQPRTVYLRDSHILWFAAQIPAHILLRVTSENLTQSVVDAYIRVLQYTHDREIVHIECTNERCQLVISSWIKQMVDHTREDHLKQVDVPDSQLCQSDLLLFRYIIEKKLGLV